MALTGFPLTGRGDDMTKVRLPGRRRKRRTADYGRRLLEGVR